VLHLTREGAVKARTAVRNQFTNLLVTAPETVKARAGRAHHRSAAGHRSRLPACDISDPTEGTKTALRALARRTLLRNAVLPHKSTNGGRFGDFGRFSWPCAEKRSPALSTGCNVCTAQGACVQWLA
jgi:hypothetical protein